jgi:hypothetical protein
MLIRKGISQAGDLGFEPKTLVFRWHSSRMAFTSQAVETPRIERKLCFNRIVRRLQSHGQCCPQFAPFFSDESESDFVPSLPALSAVHTSSIWPKGASVPLSVVGHTIARMPVRIRSTSVGELRTSTCPRGAGRLFSISGEIEFLGVAIA